MAAINPMDRAVTSVHELPLAHYRSRDPVKNLKIRVTLKRATRVGRLVSNIASNIGLAGEGISTSAVPAGSTETPGAGKAGTGNQEQQQQQAVQPEQSQAAVESGDNDDYTFSWQEKLFSRREEDAYSDRNRCILPKDVTYHNLLNQTRERYGGKRPTHHLFTYVDHDNFTDNEEFQRQSTTSPNEEPSFLAERLMTVRRRHLEGHIDTARPSRDSCGRIQPIATWKTDTRLGVAHTTPTRCQCMHIMADLTPNHLEPTPQDEYILCTLKINANGVLSVQPEFTCSSSVSTEVRRTSTSVEHKKSYLIESRHQELFEFTVEHVSLETDKETDQKEKELMKEVYRRRTDLLSSVVGEEFCEPPNADSARIVLLGEIVSAEQFDSSSLFVHYLINLPEGWYVTDKNCLSGSTQLASTSFWDWSGLVTFALPLDIEFIYCDLARSEDQLIQWPEIFFEVCSIDFWSRQHVEGYSSLRIPDTPGMHEFQLNSWRPINSSSKALMQEFFVGGTPQLQDLTYTSVLKSSKENGRLSRYGFKTETTGRLNLRMSCVHQSCLIRERQKQQKILQMAQSSKASSSAGSSSMQGVLEAFQLAKKRMQRARQGLL
ncbi:tectonic-like complex member MKS1 isoform X2 [Sycon ciliatum]|uniref:tectonic-like complex member MKS1 isoform X2 n=1 Tax=Sycon ciliatum TaxID=27933 RepID=UPI0031F69062